MLKLWHFESEILDVRDITPTVRNIKMSVPEDFVFEPGQYINYVIPDGEKTVRRAYSIASLPEQKRMVDLCVKFVDGGPGSKFFFSAKGGEKINAIGPIGNFSIKETSKEKGLVFIATGAGIAPFRSMIPFLLKNRFRNRIILLTGYRYEDEALYFEEFEDLEDIYENFLYHVIISRPRDKHYSGDVGRVQDLIKKYIPENFNGDYYLCGLNAMIQDVGKLLQDRGVGKERIIAERYD